MLGKSFSKVYKSVSKQSVWDAYTDTQSWPQWDRGLDSCNAPEQFADGHDFVLKLKDGPSFTIYLYDVEPIDRFSDYCNFFGAKMHDVHIFEEVAGGVRVTNTTIMTGPLGWLWYFLVGRHVVKGVPEQTDNMINYIKSKQG